MNIITVKNAQIHTAPYDDDITHVFHANNTPADIDEWQSGHDGATAVLFDVADFKDGRVFSLIKYLRHQGYQAEIYVGGSFALDQANYFVKSGATGFIVADDKVETLKQTLNDLQTGHLGVSVNALPMFR